MTTHTEESSAGGRRSDPPPVESVSKEVQRALRCSSHCGLHSLRCNCVKGHVTLSGEVASYYLKQIAQTIVGRLASVSSVDNQLRVVGRDANRFDR